MKLIRKNVNLSKQPDESGSYTKTKKLAATVAALGAAIGVNMGDVLADSSTLNKTSPSSINKSRVMSQQELDKIKKLRKGSRTLAPNLQRRPDTLAIKGGDKSKLRTRPSALSDKTSRKLRQRPAALADKAKRSIRKRPFSSSEKIDRPTMKHRPDIKSSKIKP